MSHFRFWRAFAAALVAAFVAVLFAGRTDATSIRLPLKELSNRSPLVVRGWVERIESAWNADREIESIVYVRLGDAPRGHLSSGGLIPVRIRGGQVDGLTMVSEEEPTFQNGEEVYLFLAGLSDDAYRITAGRQGKFEIVGDRAINRAWRAEFRLTELETGVAEDRWPAEPSSFEGTPLPAAIRAAGTPAPASPGAGAEALPGSAPDAYVYNKFKWFGPNAMEESYLINVNTADAGGANGTVDAFSNAIIAAGNTWSNAGAAFSFKYGGTSNITTTGYDDRNVVHWENMGNTPTLAEATWWKHASGQIVETDIRFNDYYAWDATGAPSRGEPDLQSIALHELGHWLSLGHDTDSSCPNSTAVMCPSYVMGTLKRTLGANDVAAIKSIYGPASTLPAPTPTRAYAPTLSPKQIKSRLYLPMIRRSH